MTDRRKNSVEWLRMMAEFSHLTDCKPHFEIAAIRMENLQEVLLIIAEIAEIRAVLVDDPEHWLSVAKIARGSLAVAGVGVRKAEG